MPAPLIPKILDELNRSFEALDLEGARVFPKSGEPLQILKHLHKTQGDLWIAYASPDPDDEILNLLLIQADAVVLAVSPGVSLSVLQDWGALMASSNTEFLGWVFLQPDVRS